MCRAKIKNQIQTEGNWKKEALKQKEPSMKMRVCS